jgi:two-component system chemotaxis response regulator CheY
MRVLIADDNDSVRRITARALRHAGADSLQILEASDGTMALEMIQNHHPDLVLCDLNMPEMSGMEVLQHLRVSGNSVRFGLVTGDEDPLLRQRALQAGAGFVLVKPFAAQEIRTLMRTAEPASLDV